MSEKSKDILNFYDYTPVDHARHCPHYTLILNRHANDSIALDEIDGLQLDLETLLVAATRRIRQLQSELQSLADSAEPKKEKKAKNSNSTSGDLKRSKSTSADDNSSSTSSGSNGGKPSKKAKLESSSSSKDGSSTPKPPTSSSSNSSGSSSGRTKLKMAVIKPIEPLNSDPDAASSSEEPPPPRVPVNDQPSKFWQSIEPYCAPITEDTIKLLEDMIEPKESMSEYFQVPDLGMHFSKRWEMEDLREEQSEGNRANIRSIDKNGENTAPTAWPKTTVESADDTCPYGSLTQRLISSFVESNIMAPPDDSTLLDNGRSDSVKQEAPSSKPLKPKNLQNKLEARIKNELIEQGILEPDYGEPTKDDEVLTELLRYQQELKAVQSKNKSVLNQLLQAAKSEMKRQEVQKKLQVANAEVIETFKKAMVARQKKRPLLKKEKDAAWKILKERETLSKQLKEFNI